jgi:hypothetical protein
MKVFFATSVGYDDHIDFNIGERGFDIERQETRLTHHAQLVLKPREANTLVLEPTMSLTKDEATNLLDALWNIGIRPSNGEGSAGQLGATERHLEDMRKLVFKEPVVVTPRR